MIEFFLRQIHALVHTENHQFFQTNELSDTNISPVIKPGLLTIALRHTLNNGAHGQSGAYL